MTEQIVVVDPGNYTPFYNLNLCEALAAIGCDVELVTSRHLFEAIPRPASVRVTNLFFSRVKGTVRRYPALRRRRFLRQLMKALLYPADLVRFDRALARRPSGVLHIQWALFPWIDAWFWRRWRARGWTIVYTAHDVMGLSGTTPRALRLAHWRLFRLAAAVIVHSSRDRVRMIAAGMPADQVRRVAQGGPGIFLGAPIEQCAARKALGIDPDRKIVLLFGFLKAYKGLGLLLSSLEVVRAHVPDVLLLIAGEPMMRLRKWTRLIQARGLERHVVWHQSYVPTERVPAYFAAADVVALPYADASSSGVLLNAFARARPVVATDVGAIGETMVNAETGLLVPANDAVGLAAALEALLHDPAKAASMGRAAEEHSQRHQDWRLIAQETTKVYRAAIEAAQTAR